MPDTVRALVRDYLICLAFYSRLPLERLARTQPPWSMADFAGAARLAPLAGATIGALTAVALILADAVLDLPAVISAALALSAQVLAGGALHEDGLADVADGFGGGATRERKLDIMRDSRIGTFGALALIFGTLLKIAALGTVLDRAGLPAAGLALVAAGAASRGFGLLPLAMLPPARTDGLAHAAGRLRRRTLWVACALALGLGVLLPALGGIAPWRSLLACGAALAAAAGTAWLADRQIGGQTGDVSGAAQQLGEISFWLALCLAPRLG